MDGGSLHASARLIIYSAWTNEMIYGNRKEGESVLLDQESFCSLRGMTGAYQIQVEKEIIQRALQYL